MWRLAVTLAVHDIKLRYRGSVLGPFWLTLSTGMMISMMGVLYASLFHVELPTYLPFLSLSIVLWNFVAATITDSCSVFSSHEGIIRSLRLPFTLYAARVVVRNMLVTAHSLIVVVIVYCVFDFRPGFGAFLVLPGLVLWSVVVLAMVMIIGILCARFRDVPPIIASLMQIAFFVSGVIWLPAQMQRYESLLALNPFFSLLEIVRGPLLGRVPSPEIYVAAVGYAGLIVLVAVKLFARSRSRIAFWL